MGSGGCRGKLTPLLNREAVLLKTLLLLKFWKCLILFSTFWLTCMRWVCENMFAEAWKLIPPRLPPLRSSAVRFRVKRLWIESSLWHQGLSSALHIQISCILCWGGGLGLGAGQLCCWGMHVKRHWRPVNSRLLICCNIMDHLGHKEPGGGKIDARIEIYCLPRGVWNRSEPGDNAHFLQQCLFNLDSPSSGDAWLSAQRGDLLMTYHRRWFRNAFTARACRLDSFYFAATGDVNSNVALDRDAGKKTFMIGKLAAGMLKYPPTSVSAWLAHILIAIRNQAEVLSDIWRWGQWRHLVLLSGHPLHNDALYLCDCLPQLTAGRIPATGGFC